jgi:hypothetical protein
LPGRPVDADRTEARGGQSGDGITNLVGERLPDPHRKVRRQGSPTAEDLAEVRGV